MTEELPPLSDPSAPAKRSLGAAVVTGLHVNYRETLSTTIHDAAPSHRYSFVGPSIYPLLMSLSIGTTFIGGIFTPWSLPIGIVMASLAMFGWFWSNSKHHRPPYSPAKENPKPGEPEGDIPFEDRS